MRLPEERLKFSRRKIAQLELAREKRVQEKNEYKGEPLIKVILDAKLDLKWK